MAHMQNDNLVHSYGLNEWGVSTDSNELAAWMGKMRHLTFWLQMISMIVSAWLELMNVCVRGSTVSSTRFHNLPPHPQIHTHKRSRSSGTSPSPTCCTSSWCAAAAPPRSRSSSGRRGGR